MKIQHRYFQLDTSDDGDSRQVEASLSSETPVYRPGLGNEILEHSASAVDLSRAPLPLLTGHDTGRLPVGIVENVRVVGRKLRGILRFSENDQGEALWRDVKAGIVRNISIAYQILDGRADGDNYIATRWQPFEVSIVSVPADATVGIGRSFQFEGKNEMNTNIEETLDNHQTRSQRRAENSANNAERERVSEIIAIGEAYAKRGGEKLALKFVREGKSVEAFRNALLEMGSTNYAERETDMLYNPNSSAQRSNEYSLLRVLNAAATGDWKHAGFEREMGQEMERQSGRRAKGLLIPFSALTGQRVMTAGNATGGATLIPTAHMGFVDLLRNYSRVIEAGATILPGLQGNIEIPKQTGASTGEWIAEDGALSGSDLTLGAVTLSPKTVGGMLKWSRRMLLNAQPEIEQIARNDLAQVIGLAIDRAALHGSGSANQPSGIYTVSDVNSLAMGGVPTYAKLIDMAAELAQDNALQGSLAFMTTPGIAATLAKTLVASSAGSEMVWSGSLLEGAMAGFKAYATNQVSSTLGAGAEHGLILGNWSELLIGMWGGGVDMLVDPYTDADRGRVRITAFCDLDIALRHGQSFCKATGAAIA